MTPQTPPPSLPDTLAELNALCHYFIDAENRIMRGEKIDMTGMDVRVNTICQAVQAAMPEQQEQYLPELTALLGLLTSCEAALRSMTPPEQEGEQTADDKGQSHA